MIDQETLLRIINTLASAEEGAKEYRDACIVELGEHIRKDTLEAFPDLAKLPTADLKALGEKLLDQVSDEGSTHFPMIKATVALAYAAGVSSVVDALVLIADVERVNATPPGEMN